MTLINLKKNIQKQRTEIMDEITPIVESELLETIDGEKVSMDFSLVNCDDINKFMLEKGYEYKEIKYNYTDFFIGIFSKKNISIISLWDINSQIIELVSLNQNQKRRTIESYTNIVQNIITAQLNDKKLEELETKD